MKKKVIGLVGFFGWGNYGDELFVEAYKQALGEDFELRILHDIQKKPYYSKPVKQVLKDIDAIIIGGGDIVLPWTISELYWKKEYLDLPVFIAGVGVPTWKGGNSNVIREMADFFQHKNVRFINSRDMESRKWIEKHLQPKIEVTNSADLVFGMQLPDVTKPKDPILGVVTRDRKGEPDDLSNVEALCKKGLSEGFAIRHIILGSGEVGIKDLERSADLMIPEKEVVYSESIWELTKAIGECTVLTSMKFHGTVVAAAYGVPSLVLSPTDKSRNLMRMIEREELLSSISDKNLPDRFSKYMAKVPTQSRHFLKRRALETMRKLKDSLHATLD